MKTTAAMLLMASCVMPLSAQAQSPRQPRLNAGAMSCAQAAGAVQQHGAAIITSAFSRRTDRYVSSRAFCTPQETIIPDWIATRDTPQCFIGYRCNDFTNPYPTDGGGFNWRFD